MALRRLSIIAMLGLLASGCTTVYHPAGLPSCEPLNEGARIDQVTLRYITPSSEGGMQGWSGIVASGSITSEFCTDLVLLPKDFALSSATGALKCGDAKTSVIEAKYFGGPAFPLTLQPGQVSPAVVAFEGRFVEDDGMTFYPDLGLHC